MLHKFNNQQVDGRLSLRHFCKSVTESPGRWQNRHGFHVNFITLLLDAKSNRLRFKVLILFNFWMYKLGLFNKNCFARYEPFVLTSAVADLNLSVSTISVLGKSRPSPYLPYFRVCPIPFGGFKNCGNASFFP